MNLFGFFRSRPRSAEQAKERLQILLAHERVDRSGPDYLPMLQTELLQVIEKYIAIDREKVQVKIERGSDVSTLEVDIELPGAKGLTAQARAQLAAPASGRS